MTKEELAAAAMNVLAQDLDSAHRFALEVVADYINDLKHSLPHWEKANGRIPDDKFLSMSNGDVDIERDCWIHRQEDGSWKTYGNKRIDYWMRIPEAPENENGEEVAEDVLPECEAEPSAS